MSFVFFFDFFNILIENVFKRYGESAGNVAGTTFDTVGNVINVSQNINYMTPKGFVKKTAKGAGKAIVEELRPKTSGRSIVPAGALYPDLSGFAKEIEKHKTVEIP